jgi:hypothetical protein
MAISSVDLYNFVNVLANKAQDGAFTIPEYNIAAYAASVQLWEEYIGEIQRYQYGSPIPPVAYAKTNKIEADMVPFRIPLVAVTASSTGVIDLSALPNYGYTTDLYRYQTISGQEVVYPSVRVNEQRLAKQLSSSIAQPTLENPYYMVNNATIKVYPSSSNVDYSAYKLTYLKRPDNRVVKYTLSGGRPVITPVTAPTNPSEMLEWNQQNFNDLAVRILSFLGINLKDSDLMQYSELKQRQGV